MNIVKPAVMMMAQKRLPFGTNEPNDRHHSPSTMLQA